MDELVAWFRQQLDEEAAVAKDATRGPWTVHRQGVEAIVSPGVAMDREEGGVSVQDATHIVRHDPTAVLADIEAKRAVLDAYTTRADLAARGGLTNRDPLGFAVRTLARAYRHRPGWKSSWE